MWVGVARCGWVWLGVGRCCSVFNLLLPFSFSDNCDFTFTVSCRLELSIGVPRPLGTYIPLHFCCTLSCSYLNLSLHWNFASARSARRLCECNGLIWNISWLILLFLVRKCQNLKFLRFVCLTIVILSDEIWPFVWLSDEICPFVWLSDGKCLIVWWACLIVWCLSALFICIRYFNWKVD